MYEVFLLAGLYHFKNLLAGLLVGPHFLPKIKAFHACHYLMLNKNNNELLNNEFFLLSLFFINPAQPYILNPILFIKWNLSITDTENFGCNNNIIKVFLFSGKNVWSWTYWDQNTLSLVQRFPYFRGSTV